MSRFTLSTNDRKGTDGQRRLTSRPGETPIALHRILVGVAAGVGILAILFALARRFPAAAGFLFFELLGGVFVFLAYHALRTGVVGTRSGRYERGVRPFEFWFFTLFIGLVGLGVCAYAVSTLFYR